MGTQDVHNSTLYGSEEVERVLDAMSATLAAKLQGAVPVSLVGVRRRGALLADHLHGRLRKQLPGLDLE
jgi:pyrimidine operon attenuation protein/uracil phosphoribosyltransferase